MTPFFFGPPERRLFGLFQPAQPRAATAALLCNPFGSEAIRSHRLYRVLADRLTRSGVDVMRFDYFASGDSAGDDAQGDLAGSARDVVAAHETLVQRSRAERTVWMGARLGASLAVNATRAVARAPNCLVLWDTVIDGAAYLTEMAQRQQLLLEESFKPGELPWQAMTATRADLDREGLGVELGSELRAQLKQLSPASLAPPRAVRCHVIDRGSRRDMSTLVAEWKRAGLIVNESILEHELDWLRQEALDTALVPAGAIERLLHAITDSA